MNRAKTRALLGSVAAVVALAAASATVVITRGGNSHVKAAEPSASNASVQSGGTAQTTAGQIDQVGNTAGYLGVQVSDSNGKVAVSQIVPGGPADKAGIKSGDVITAVDGISLSTSDSLTKALAAKKSGDTVTVSIDRNGAKQDIKVTLGDRPRRGSAAGGFAGLNRGFLGITVNYVDDAAKQKYSLTSTDGALIVGVNAGGPAANAGLKEGDLITSVNGKAVKNTTDLRTALEGTKAGDSATVQYQRAGTSQTAMVTLTAPAGPSTSAQPLAPGTGGTGALPGIGAFGGNFYRFISSETKTKDTNGTVHTDTTIAGVVKSVSSTQMVITPNGGGGDQTFTIDTNTKIVKGPRGKGQAGDLAANDKVFVTTRDGSTTARSVLAVNGLQDGIKSILGGANSGGFQIQPGNGGIQIHTPGGQDITIPFPGTGNPGATTPPRTN